MRKRVAGMIRILARVGRTSLGAALLLAGLGAVAWAQNTAPTPEIDAGSAASALAFLSGGVMLLKDWLRTK